MTVMTVLKFFIWFFTTNIIINLLQSMIENANGKCDRHHAIWLHDNEVKELIIVCIYYAVTLKQIIMNVLFKIKNDTSVKRYVFNMIFYVYLWICLFLSIYLIFIHCCVCQMIVMCLDFFNHFYFQSHLLMKNLYLYLFSFS